VALGPRPAGAVIAHSDPEDAVVDVRLDRGVPRAGVLRAGVLRDVGQRLGHDEVGRRLHRWGQPVHVHAHLHRHRLPLGDRLDRRTQPAPREDGGKAPVHELAQLGNRLFGLVE
jgi:hypothetical protein